MSHSNTAKPQTRLGGDGASIARAAPHQAAEGLPTAAVPGTLLQQGRD